MKMKAILVLNTEIYSRKSAVSESLYSLQFLIYIGISGIFVEM